MVIYRVILGLRGLGIGFTGIMENKMETTIMVIYRVYMQPASGSENGLGFKV